MTNAPRVALETTLLLHGVPVEAAPDLDRELRAICTSQGAEPALVGVIAGEPTVGITESQLAELLREGADIPKANTANLGLYLQRGQHAASTVSTTMELAADAGVRVFATGGIGGVHKGYGSAFDISADLAAFTRFPVAVVTSGVKSLLDVAATREALETLGVPVVGWRTDEFPAFYQRESGSGVDARFDDANELARFLSFELERTGRGVVVCNPIPEADELDPAQFAGWLREAEREASTAGVKGRDVTPFLLGRLHALSDGATLRANLALVRENARVAATLASEMARL